MKRFGVMFTRSFKSKRFSIFRSLILFEDSKIIVVNKPANLLVQGNGDDPCLYQLGKDYIKRTCDKKGEVFLGIVHRLDRVTSGVVLLARNSKAASRVSESIKEHAAKKVYLAIVHGRPESEELTCKHFLTEDASDRVRVFDSSSQTTEGTKEAILSYKVLHYVSPPDDDSADETAHAKSSTISEVGSDLSGNIHGGKLPNRKVKLRRQGVTLVEVHLVTGRKHQIRAQMAHLGHPVVGDVKYGGRDFSSVLGEDSIALHAYSLSLPHPTSREMVHFTAPPPTSWATLMGKSEKQ